MLVRLAESDFNSPFLNNEGKNSLIHTKYKHKKYYQANYQKQYKIGLSTVFNDQ